MLSSLVSYPRQPTCVGDPDSARTRYRHTHTHNTTRHAQARWQFCRAITRLSHQPTPRWNRTHELEEASQLVVTDAPHPSPTALNRDRCTSGSHRLLAPRETTFQWADIPLHSPIVKASSSPEPSPHARACAAPARLPRLHMRPRTTRALHLAHHEPLLLLRPPLTFSAHRKECGSPHPPAPPQASRHSDDTAITATPPPPAPPPSEASALATRGPSVGEHANAPCHRGGGACRAHQRDAARPRGARATLVRPPRLLRRPPPAPPLRRPAQRFSRASAKMSCLNGSEFRKDVSILRTCSEMEALVVLASVRFSNMKATWRKS